MKKIIIIVVVLFVVAGLSACGNKSDNQKVAQNDNTNQNVNTKEIIDPNKTVLYVTKIGTP